ACQRGTTMPITARPRAFGRSCAASSTPPSRASTSSWPPPRRTWRSSMARRKTRCRCTSTTFSRFRATCPAFPASPCPAASAAPGCRSGCRSSAARWTKRACCGRPTPTSRRPRGDRGSQSWYDGMTASDRYEVVIGLEVHAQLLTRSKMFCGCTTKFGAPPNSQTCPVCQGMPGVLPVINRRAVEFGIRTALAFECRVNPACRFARKHYYYPDMPKNYQISQYEEPLAEDGFLEIDVDGGTHKIAIQRLHLEEDVGKLLHEGTLETAQASLVDFNRSGVPLMETVSRPELRSPEEAAAYLKAFRAVLIF